MKPGNNITQDKTVKFAFIGCGKVSHFHAEVIRALGHEIIGAAVRPGSKNIKRFAEKYSVPATYSDFRAMFQEMRPDAVVVCTSWNVTENLIEEILDRGYPVLLEKPVALSAQRLKSIIYSIGKYAGKVLIGYNRRFYDFVPRLKEAVETKELLSIDLVLPEGVDRLVHRFTESIRDHILIYLSSHWLDLIYYLIGDIDVLSMHNKLNKDGYVKSYNGLLLAKKNSIPIHYQSDFDTPQRISIKFVFSDSIYLLSPLERLCIFKGLDCIDPTDDFPIRRYEPNLIREEYTDLGFKPGFFNQMKYFIDTYVYRKNYCEKIGCTLDDALATTRLCEEIKNFPNRG